MCNLFRSFCRVLVGASRRFAMLGLVLPGLALAGCGPGNSNGNTTAQIPGLSVTPSTLAFSTVVVGTASASQVVTLSSTGGVAVVIAGIAASGDFTQTNNCGSTLAVQASCTVTVTFSPTVVGARTGTLTIADNATGSPQTVTLTGTGLGPNVPLITFAPSALTLPSVNLGQTSSAQVVVTDTGSAAATISGISVTGDFSQTNTCGSTLAVQASCIVTVTFAPTIDGVRSGMLSIADNVSGSPQLVALTGTGTVPAVTLSTTAIGFGSVKAGTTSAATVVTLTDSGSGTLNITGITSSLADFGYTTTCGATLAAGASCTISITFTPSTSGVRNGTLSIADNAPGSSQMITLSGGGPLAAIGTTLLNFGSVPVGNSPPAFTGTLTNGGTVPLTLTGIAIQGDYVQTNNCGTSLAPGTTCTFLVTFTPTQTGTRMGMLTITDNAPTTSQTFNLTGVGIAAGNAVAVLSYNAVTFGSLPVGSSSSPYVVTVTSSGAGALTFNGITATGDFAASNNCGAKLAYAANCQASIVFTPTATGTRTGTLTIATNGAGSPQTVSLTGTGTAVAAYPTMVPFTVQVQAGTVPVGAAQVQLYTMGTSGSGSAATALLPVALVTGTSGAVTIPQGIVCQSAGAQVYALSRGGLVAPAATSNAALTLMTAIGSCSGIASGVKVTVDEASTVAAAYALRQFYGGSGNFGATASNTIGAANAFATAATLVDVAAGTSPGSTLASNTNLSSARLNSLANLLNSCAIASANCPALFTAAAVAGSTPANTLDLAYAIAANPGNNVAGLYGLSGSSTAYAPALTAAPTDWTMFLTVSGGGLVPPVAKAVGSPSGLGIDSQGSVWVSNYFGEASKFTATGAAVFPNGLYGQCGLNNSYGLSIDLSDDVWIPNEQPFTGAGVGTVSEISSTGTCLSAGSNVGGFALGGMNYPISTANDPNGTVWVIQYGDSYVTLLNSSGVPISPGIGYTSSTLAFPVAVAIDANHNGWIANQSGLSTTRMDPSGNFTGFPDCCNAASGVAIDQFNNAWFSNFYGNSVSVIKSYGDVSSRGYTAVNTIVRPQGIAFDGASNAWMSLYREPYLTEVAGSGTANLGAALSPATGYGADAGLLEAYALAIDASGNIWVSNQGSATVTKFIGLATPVKTPLSEIPQLP